MKHKLFITLTILLISLPGFSQRLIPGQSAVGLSIHTIDGLDFTQNKFSFSIALSYNRYTKGGNWKGGLEYAQLRSIYNQTYIPYSQITGEGGYSWRIFSNYRKSLILSGGVSILVGYESIGNKELSPGKYLTQESKFIYGFCPHLIFDFFLSRKIAVEIAIRERLNFNSSLQNNHFLAGIGLKYLIN